MPAVNAREDSYYRHDLALVHHRGFALHASACAPGVLKLLEPVLARNGLVLEIGCGTGLLTCHLVEAGHRLIATDASEAMLEVARDYLGDHTPQLRRLALPDDPLPEVDAIIGIGHPISYLPNADGSWRRAFEHHENPLIDTSRLPHRLARLGITAQIHPAFGDETLPDGLHVVIGKREL